MISKREYQIAELIAWDASDKEVAHELNISWNTAKTHRHNILVKIGGGEPGKANAADLTRWFFQRKAKQCFGLSPRKIRHIAMGLLLLIGVSEFLQTDMIRVRRVKARTAKPPKPIKTGKTFKLKYA